MILFDRGRKRTQVTTPAWPWKRNKKVPIITSIMKTSLSVHTAVRVPHSKYARCKMSLIRGNLTIWNCFTSGRNMDRGTRNGFGVFSSTLAISMQVVMVVSRSLYNVAHKCTDMLRSSLVIAFKRHLIAFGIKARSSWRWLPFPSSVSSLELLFLRNASSKSFCIANLPPTLMRSTS